jgi:myo-inositol-1(or 4)-monophosphatase
MGQGKDLNLEQTKQFMIEIAKEAGKIAKQKFGKVKDYRNKERAGQQVCEVDLECEKLIKDRIRKKFPDHGILAEESSDQGEKPKESEYLWVIDPIDGTRNYLHGHPSFGVSIALAKNKEVILGVVYMPMYDWTYSAVKGQGSEKNGKEISVSERTTDDDLLCNFGCNFLHEKEEQLRVLNNYIDVVKKVRVEGSAVFGFCLVAEGVFDSYIQRFIQPWDCAAACFIIQEAGGKVTDYEGNPWTLYMDKIVSSNGKIHDKLLEAVK